jgi:hypothetical protein
MIHGEQLYSKNSLLFKEAFIENLGLKPRPLAKRRTALQNLVSYDQPV